MAWLLPAAATGAWWPGPGGLAQGGGALAAPCCRACYQAARQAPRSPAACTPLPAPRLRELFGMGGGGGRRGGGGGGGRFFGRGPARGGMGGMSGGVSAGWLAPTPMLPPACWRCVPQCGVWLAQGQGRGVRVRAAAAGCGCRCRAPGRQVAGRAFEHCRPFPAGFFFPGMPGAAFMGMGAGRGRPSGQAGPRPGAGAGYGQRMHVSEVGGQGGCVLLARCCLCGALQNPRAAALPRGQESAGCRPLGAAPNGLPVALLARSR
jgi:hypothetical protein